MGDGIAGGDSIAAVIRDGVIKQLRWVGVEQPVVFSGDFSSYLLQYFVGFGAGIGARDFHHAADVSRGNTLGDCIGSLVIVFRDLAMTFFVFMDVLRYAVGHPYGEVELQGHFDLGDSERCARGISLQRVPAYRGTRKKTGIALGVLGSSKRRHFGGGIGRIKSALSEIDRLFDNCGPRGFAGGLRRRGMLPVEKSEDKDSQQRTKQK